MKIKLDGIDQEITLQQAKDIYCELMELFDSNTITYPGHLYNPMTIKYGPESPNWTPMDFPVTSECCRGES